MDCEISVLEVTSSFLQKKEEEEEVTSSIQVCLCRAHMYPVHLFSSILIYIHTYI